MAQSQDLKFVPWFTDIDLGFCPALAHLKINHDKLDDSARKVVGRYEVRPNEAAQSAARMSIPGNALTSDETSSGQCRAEGILRNVNTIEEYRALDKTAVLERAGRTIWDAIVDGTVYSCPSLLVSFYAVFFADLKKYKFTNRFAFPALHSDWKLATGDQATSKKLAPLETTFLVDAVQTWRYAVDARQHGFFLAKRRKALESEVEARRDDSDPLGEDEIRWTVGSLLSFEQGFFEGVAAEDAYVCFLDPSTYPQNPGVMLRNLLVLARQRWKLDKMQVLCYRDTHSRRERPNSLILQLVHPESAASQTPEMPRVTGWERYQNNRANSLIDLGEFMDPRRLADQAIDLNLKLMKWRIAPDLDLDAVKNTKCLLLGAGTLGSYVARNLLGWGVRKITFVDNARVSFSNPVRQPLYGFADCLAGGAPKATRAAAALREIYPGVDAAGVVMAVPMAGHPVPDADAAAAQADFEQLRALVDAHDVVFLLMDSRESRWLPTVMARAAGKLVMNAALGFDTYLVMRHGVAADPAALPELGCYFCNDVVAPVDCTVTRPGVAALASALLVELLVSTLQHPSRGLAPAPLNRAAPAATPLGLVPHAVRGFLAAFDNVLVHGPAFAHCSACSAPVAAAYAADGWAFVRRALAQPRFVEELCGLADVQRAADAAAEDVEWEPASDGEPELL